MSIVDKDLQKSVFGIPQYTPDIGRDGIQNILDEVLLTHPSGLLILCCDTEPQHLAFFDELLPNVSIPVFGGVFPSIIYQTHNYQQGILVVPVFATLTISVFSQLGLATGKSFKFDQSLHQHESFIVLVDGLSRNIDYGLNQIFTEFGDKPLVFGGGAGSLSFEQRPCLFTNQGLIADAMLIVGLQHSFKLAVGHGWEVLEGPFLANQVDDNQILQLNFQPAFDVYSEVVEKHAGRSFTDDNFFELAKSFPFGIDRLDDDLLVRDPLTCDEKSMVCVGKIPENTMLYILNADSTKLINAAANAVTSVSTGDPYQCGLLFDCISRQLFLEEQFNEELEQISQQLDPQAKLFGALVLGEIASSKYGAINFHNKTAVVALANKD